jgi:ACS family tartrate transporter-like MFS transporter
MTGSGTPPCGREIDGLKRWLWGRGPASLAERTRRRVTLHLIPYLFFLYILAYLDRVNVSVAALRMAASPAEGGLGFSQDVIGFGAGIFFWGYWILEVPSTLSVLKWGARWVFVRILVLWGLACVLVGSVGTPFADSLFAWLPQLDPAIWGSGIAGFVNGLASEPKNQFYVFRFLLGFFEGGFFPSVILYLSLWFRPEDRARAIAGFMAAIPLSSVIGMPISGLLLDLHWFDLPGWRWIFILQGALPVLAGFATLFFLPDRPEHAAWLPEEERAYLVAELHREQQHRKAHSFHSWSGQLGTVLLLTLVYFGLNVSSYGLQMFLPKIIKTQTGLTDVGASLVAASFYLIAFVAMLVNGRHSDHTHERIGHVAVPLLCLAVGTAAAAALTGQGLWPVFVMVFVVGTFMFAHLPAFWPLPTKFLGATAAAAAIGFINMIGNLGGSVGPMIVGSSAGPSTSQRAATAATAIGSFGPFGQIGGLITPAAVMEHGESFIDFRSALFRLAPFPAAAAAIVLIIWLLRRKQLAARPEQGEVQVVDTTETLLISASLTSSSMKDTKEHEERQKPTKEKQGPEG